MHCSILAKRRETSTGFCFIFLDLDDHNLLSPSSILGFSVRCTFRYVKFIWYLGLNYQVYNESLELWTSYWFIVINNFDFWIPWMGNYSQIQTVIFFNLKSCVNRQLFYDNLHWICRGRYYISFFTIWVFCRGHLQFLGTVMPICKYTSEIFYCTASNYFVLLLN